MRHLLLCYWLSEAKHTQKKLNFNLAFIFLSSQQSIEQATSYKTIKQPSEGLFRDRGSKFYSYAYPISSRADAAAVLEELRAEHPKSRHHCLAYRIGAQGQDYRISDDGEPAGSAGQPIYNQLLSHDLTNVIVIVVRYFGGTKLGIPGLINAYKIATIEALNQTTIIERQLSAYYSISTSYDHSARLMNAFKEHKFNVEKVSYEARVTFSLGVPIKNHRPSVNLAIAQALNLQAVEMLEDLDASELMITLIEIES